MKPLYRVRRDILRDLRNGYPVDYIGKAPSMQGKEFIKIKDFNSKKMRVKVFMTNDYYDVSYYNLTCDKIETAIKVSDRLANGVKDDDSDMPF